MDVTVNSTLAAPVPPSCASAIVTTSLALNEAPRFVGVTLVIAPRLSITTSNTAAVPPEGDTLHVEILEYVIPVVVAAWKVKFAAPLLPRSASAIVITSPTANPLPAVTAVSYTHLTLPTILRV